MAEIIAVVSTVVLIGVLIAQSTPQDTIPRRYRHKNLED